jgi:hypothetical protein
MIEHADPHGRTSMKMGPASASHVSILSHSQEPLTVQSGLGAAYRTCASKAVKDHRCECGSVVGGQRSRGGVMIPGCSFVMPHGDRRSLRVTVLGDQWG